MAITGFAAALGIYAIIFFAYVSFLQAPAGVSEEGPVLGSRANAGLNQMLTSPGSTSQSAVPWVENPDDITRFGLAPEGQPGHLDLDKMRNLSKGSMLTDATNDLLDYEEAKDALDLGDYDFHLRTYPLLSTLDEAGPEPIKQLDVAYVGDWIKQPGGGGAADYPVQYSSTVENRTDHVFANVTITNNGTEDTLFQVEFSVHLQSGYLVDTANTPLLARDPDGSDPLEGGSHTVSLKLYKTSSWRWADDDEKHVSVQINDPRKNVADFDIDIAHPMDSSTSNNPDYAAVAISPERMKFRDNQKIKVELDLWKGNGNTKDNIDLTAALKYSNGTLIEEKSAESGDNIEFDDQDVGWYILEVRRDSDAAFNSTDHIQVTNADAGEFLSGTDGGWEESEASKYERSLLLDLVENFVNATYDADGDVYPDQKTVMNSDLAANLSAGNYDVLVVGSDIDQTAMTSAAAKDAVKNFVMGGGLLVVLGSLDQQVTWLQPLFHASLTTSGDGVGVPDPTHPILHVPMELAWQTYPDNGRTWEFNSDDDAAHFTHVIVREGGGSRQQDVLAVSKPGHFGNGTIILTAWTIFGLTSPQNDLEAKSVFYNFVLHALGSLYVDFGPRLPDHAEVSSARRVATTKHPAIPDEKVLVRVVLYVFR